MTTTTTLDLAADIIDVRDIIARVEELEPQVDTIGEGEHIAEWNMLTRILHELNGYGGDEQWRGDWYPVTLIDDAYFVDYVQDMLADCGEVPRDLPHYIEIDWRATARNVQTDYSSVEIDGRTYWYR
ncbi:MAG: hypothetical protein ACO3GP_04910 [Candidatus Limnocylindrus sp.]